MPTCSILQIGDIHYPLYSNEAVVDDKLDASSGFLAGLAINPIATVMQFISNMVSTIHVDFAAFVGDFTDAGNSSEFDKSLEFFGKAFKAIKVPAFGVPGNHDLEWPKILTRDYDKFAAFQAIANNHSDSIRLSFDRHTKYDCSPGALSATALYAFNSCLGCSDIWKMGQLYDIDIEKHIQSLGSHNLYSRFDAPYIDQDSIASVCNEIRSNPSVVPIILAHHNLLPQRTPRVAIFPEMLNAGYVRNELKGLGRPIIYLHGHIHDSLVESLLSEDEDSQVSVVAICAPLFRDGFNHVQVFTSDDQVPLGVEIEEYRYEKVSIRSVNRRKIRFYGADKRDELLDDKGREILAGLRTAKARTYLDLSKEFSSSKLLELEFTGHLTINRTVKFNDKTWRVSAR
ncbi:hypothetical protein GR223_23655 [Rhizobium leguminosarum]|uniref:metallophosphoesterase family protein n=1 Tax=Rhizobium ruizarguesonis TaxID=2081791 RepID=UPI0013DEB19B|nr:metallophosphoesterase [Rhizobium ruizarguesonis]NEJ88891.1 hypothetical protein [Rhizobium ruizarguesonis]